MPYQVDQMVKAYPGADNNLLNLALLLMFEKFYRPGTGEKGFWEAYISLLPTSFKSPYVRPIKISLSDVSSNLE